MLQVGQARDPRSRPSLVRTGKRSSKVRHARLRSTRGSLPSPPLQNRTCHFHGIRHLASPDPLARIAPLARSLERPPFTALTRVSSHPLGFLRRLRASPLLLATRSFEMSVPTSAYLRHYPQLLLLG